MTVAEEQEDKITNVNDDAPHGLVDEKRDDLKKINISLPVPDHVIIKMDKDDNVNISSDRKQEDEIRIVNDDAHQRPMAENRDVLENTSISTPKPNDVVINRNLYKDVIISSDRKQEDKIRIVNDAAYHRPMAENRDVFVNTSISTPKPNDVVINRNLDKDVIVSSNKKQEDGTRIVNCAAHHRPEAEKRKVFQNCNICSRGPGHAAINRSPNEKLDLSQLMMRAYLQRR
ncbi:uncharacterized protein ACNLHF_012627 [Anomaloglossus baeobatrachus]